MKKIKPFLVLIVVFLALTPQGKAVGGCEIYSAGAAGYDCHNVGCENDNHVCEVRLNAQMVLGTVHTWFTCYCKETSGDPKIIASFVSTEPIDSIPATVTFEPTGTWLITGLSFIDTLEGTANGSAEVTFSIDDQDSNLIIATINNMSFDISDFLGGSHNVTLRPSPYPFIAYQRDSNSVEQIEGASHIVITASDDSTFGVIESLLQNSMAQFSFTGFLQGELNLQTGLWTCNIDGPVCQYIDTKPAVRIEKSHNSPQGLFEYISVTMEDYPLGMGGFDFLIAYDASALTFMEATSGQILKDCGWEYFTYRHGVQGNCWDACPSGLLRIIAMADITDGPNHPSCYGPPDIEPQELAVIKFLVTNDRTYECQYVPIYFFWSDCGDNSISDAEGNTLYFNGAIYDFNDNLIWDEEDDDQFPEDARIPFVGAPDYCINPDPDKPSPFRFVDFINGGIDIICADSIDVRGDINLNGAANEIADAVVFTNYFIYGLDAFTVNQEGQIAATDVNADGMVLSVADLTYLIRVIIGDALPYSKLAPVTAKYDIKDGVLSVDQEMGAAYVVIKGNVNPVNLTGNMEMKYAFDSENDVTKVLLYSMEKDQKFTGSFLEIKGTLIEIEMATYEGATVKLITDLLPTEYVLHQNKPNPFNPITDLSFSLPKPSDVTLEIYNITGQKVATVAEDHFEAGTHTVRWDGSNYASGIYMYRITAGDFTDSKKMLLLK